MTKIFHNPRCRKSRETLALVEQKEGTPEIIEYLKNPPTKKELTQIVQLLGIAPSGLLRKGEKIFKEEFKGKNLTDGQWIEAMVKNPILIVRPIVLKDGKARIGRPPEKVLDIL